MKQVTILLLMAAVLFTVSCSEKTHDKAVNVICPIDLTRSLDSSTITWYESIVAENIIPNLGPAATITILPVDGASVTASQEIFKYDCGRGFYKNEYAGLQQDEAAAKNLSDTLTAATSQFRRAFETARKSRKEFTAGTDLIGALTQAVKYLDPVKKNIVVIFSDMEQYSNKYTLNFEDSLNYYADADRFMLYAQKVNLSNTTIIVLTGKQPGITPQKYQLLEYFWETYFKSCGGSLIDFSSGATSILERELLKKEK